MSDFLPGGRTLERGPALCPGVGFQQGGGSPALSLSTVSLIRLHIIQRSQ